MAVNGTQGNKRMPWPSLDVASRAADTANILFICSLVVGVVSTVAIVWMANVKEAHWDLLRKESGEKVAVLELETANAKTEAVKATEATEILRAKNLDLEATISPRILEQNLTAQALKLFAGMSFFVASPTDFEPKRTAGQIRFMLVQAGWMLLRVTPPRPFPFFDGVVIHGDIAGGGEDKIRARAAIDLLVKTLNENGIIARSGYPVQDLGPTGILVLVGPKPLPAALQLRPESIPANQTGGRVYGNILE